MNTSKKRGAPSLASIVRGRVTCQGQRTFAIHLLLSAPVSRAWLEAIEILLVSDNGEHEFPSHALWQGDGGTFVHGQLELDMGAFRRAIGKEESRFLTTFTPFRTIRFSKGEEVHFIENRNSLALFCELGGRRLGALPEADPFLSL